MPKRDDASDAVGLSARVSEIRRAKDMSVATLAGLANVTKAYIHQIENGECPRPSARVLFDIAQALGTSIAYLLGRGAPGPEPGSTPKPEALLKLARTRTDITPEDVEMLARIRHRGHQPKTVGDWEYLWESVKRSIAKPDVAD